MTVGEKIKQRRIELNMSQDELARKCGYKSRSSINKIELSRDLPLKKVKVMANALDLSVEYLMGWADSDGQILNFALQVESESTKLNEEEAQLLQIWRELDPEKQKQIVLMAAFLKSQDNPQD